MAEKKHHFCQIKTYSSLEGKTFGICTETYDGRYLLDSTEYCVQVNFCPFCGQKAPISINTKVWKKK
jgi:hypothetical protein